MLKLSFEYRSYVDGLSLKARQKYTYLEEVDFNLINIFEFICYFFLLLVFKT